MADRRSPMADITYMPVLPKLRELYLEPRTMDRFRHYLAALTGGTDDIVLPIGIANPMAREHAIAAIDALLDVKADEIGAAAAAEAALRLRRVRPPMVITASIVLADDVGGGWTNRYTTEAMVRFPGRGALKRPFATALAWTSETPAAVRLRREVLAAIYRVAYQQRFGLRWTLKNMLAQEGLARMFAGAMPALSDQDLRSARSILATVGDDPGYPTAFACMYGDTAASELGYTPLGLPPRAGFEVALADALERDLDPVGVFSG